jgi:hypothetical protein
MPLYEFKCKECDDTEEILCHYKELEKQRPSCCDKPMDSVIGLCAIKIWNMDRATQSGEENMRMCGVDI